MADTTYFINEKTLTDIAGAIRAKDGTSTPMTASEMSTRINNISTGITNAATYTLDVEQGTSAINPGRVRADINIKTTGIMTPGWKYGEKWETVENCSSENIKSGVTILGVTGNYSGEKISNITLVDYGEPYTVDGVSVGTSTLTVLIDGVEYKVDNYDTASSHYNKSIDLSNMGYPLLPANIVKDVNIFGVTGTTTPWDGPGLLVTGVELTSDGYVGKVTITNINTGETYQPLVQSFMKPIQN